MTLGDYPNCTCGSFYYGLPPSAIGNTWATTITTPCKGRHCAHDAACKQQYTTYNQWQ